MEWGTPVLYLRAPDGRIFDVAAVSRNTPVPSGQERTAADPAPAPREAPQREERPTLPPHSSRQTPIGRREALIGTVRRGGPRAIPRSVLLGSLGLAGVGLVAFLVVLLRGLSPGGDVRTPLQGNATRDQSGTSVGVSSGVAATRSVAGVTPDGQVGHGAASAGGSALPAPVVECPTTVDFGMLVRCELASTVAFDTYRFAAQANDTVVVNATSENSYLTVGVFGPDHAQLCDGSRARDPGCTLPTSGTYTIRVADGSPTAQAPYPYVLFLGGPE